MAPILGILAALKNRGSRPANGMDDNEPDDTDPGEDMEPDENDSEPASDPRGMSADGRTLFIDKKMFPSGCQIGDTVKITAQVTKHGDKYGIVPESIAAMKSDDGTEKDGGEE